MMKQLKCLLIATIFFLGANEIFAQSKTAQGTPSLDLPAALRHVLDNAGVPIIDEFRCTAEENDLYSYRRDGVTGRQAGIISL